MLLNRIHLWSSNRYLLLLKYFKRFYYFITFYIAAGRVFFLHTLHQSFFSAESYSKLLEKSNMENFAYSVKNFKPISVHAKSLHLRCLKGFWMRLIAPVNVLCHHNKHPMRYFELLYGWRIIYLSLKYFRKIAVTTSLRKARRCRDSLPSSLLVRYNTHAP